jgi:hypothetical protein
MSTSSSCLPAFLHAIRNTISSHTP